MLRNQTTSNDEVREYYQYDEDPDDGHYWMRYLEDGATRAFIDD